MDPLTTFEIVGIAVCILLASILYCIMSYACGLMWCMLLPCRGVRYCCKSMTFDDDDHGTCCGVFGNNYVV